MAAVTICSDVGAQENKVCHYFHFFPICLPEVMWLDAMIFVFWILSFKPAFSFSSFTFIKSHFSSSSLSAIRVVSSAYLSLLILILAILILSCASFSPAFHMIYLACELNKQGDNMQPWCTSFPILNQFIVPCFVLNVASLPAYRFLRRQVPWSGIPISFRIFCSLLWSTVSGFGIVNKAEVDVFFWNSFAFSKIQWMLAIGSYLFCCKCSGLKDVVPDLPSA